MLVINQRRWLSLSCLGLKLSLRLRLSLKKAYKHVLSLLDLFLGNGDPWKWGKKNGSKGVQIHETHILHFFRHTLSPGTGRIRTLHLRITNEAF